MGQWLSLTCFKGLPCYPQHVLRGCLATYYVWSCLVPCDMLDEFFSLGFEDRLLYNLTSKMCFSSIINWKMIFGVACWFLWQRRNKEIFDVNFVLRGSPSMAVVQYTELIHRSSSLTSKFKACREEKLIGWKPHLTNWVKL